MRSKLAVWSLLCPLLAIISVFLISQDPNSSGFVVILWFALLITGIVLGILGIRAIRKDKKLGGVGYAVAGLIISSVLFGISLMALLLLVSISRAFSLL